jgi:hypothetical protein
MMAMERPRGFKLDLRAPMNGKVADIGSNDKEFWFWVSDKKDKKIYVCDYQDVKDSQLAVTYQPDWIVEAMGLREISPRDAATIAARPGEKEGELVLTQARNDNRGGMLTKETIVYKDSGRIKEHRLWAGPKKDPKDLLARATVIRHQEITLKPTDEDPSGATIQLPEIFKLEWVAEKFALEVTMSEVKVNTVFAPEQRTALFKEPEIAGITRVNLAQLSSPAGAASQVYETLPDRRSGVRLGQPEPVRTEVEGAYRPRRDPAPASSDLSLNLPRPSTEVVGAPIPRGRDPEAYRASAVRRSSWRPALLDR